MSLVNFIPDYISVIQTRYLLRLFKTKINISIKNNLIFFLIDFLLTTLIIFLAFIIVDGIMTGFRFDNIESYNFCTTENFHFMI